MHLVEAAGAKVLLDAGLFQGKRTEAAAAMAIILKECGVGEVTIPRLGESFLL